MILDLHNHSIKSDDGRARVESYCQWIRKKELPLDGFVLTEHRRRSRREQCANKRAGNAPHARGRLSMPKPSTPIAPTQAARTMSRSKNQTSIPAAVKRFGAYACQTGNSLR